MPYPIRLKNTVKYFEAAESNRLLSAADHEYLFTAKNIRMDKLVAENNSRTKLTPERFSGTELFISLKTDTATNLVLLQNYYPHWFFEKTGTRKEVLKAGINFMAATISKEDTSVIFIFDPSFIKTMMLVSLLIFAALIFLFCFLHFKPFFLSSHQRLRDS